MKAQTKPDAIAMLAAMQPGTIAIRVQPDRQPAQIKARQPKKTGARAGTRQIRLETDYAEVMGKMTNSLFSITN